MSGHNIPCRPRICMHFWLFQFKRYLHNTLWGCSHTLVDSKNENIFFCIFLHILRFLCICIFPCIFSTFFENICIFYIFWHILSFLHIFTYFRSFFDLFLGKFMQIQVWNFLKCIFSHICDVFIVHILTYFWCFFVHIAYIFWGF